MKQVLIILLSVLLLWPFNANAKDFRIRKFHNYMNMGINRGCSFSETEQELDKGVFMFTITDSSLTITINEQIGILKLVKGDGNIFGNAFLDTYQNEYYKVTVDMNYSKKGPDKNKRYEGNMIIVDNNGKAVSKKIFCACSKF